MFKIIEIETNKTLGFFEHLDDAEVECGLLATKKLIEEFDGDMAKYPLCHYNSFKIEEV